MSQTRVFWKSYLYKFHTLLAPFILQNFKKNSYIWSRIITMCHFWVKNAPFALNKKSLVEIINITSICILAPFSMQNFKKIFRGDQDLWRWTIFGSKLVHLPQARTFLGKVVNIVFTYLLIPFPVQSFKRFLQWIQSYENVPFLDPKWAYLPKLFFSEKACSYHSCLSRSQKLNWDINLLTAYWRLKNTEISLAESHFWA